MPKPSRYLPRSWVCSTSSRSSSAASNRNAVDLCTPMSAATSLTPASPRWARISNTLMARSTDCTPPALSPRSLPMAQLYDPQLHIEELDSHDALRRRTAMTGNDSTRYDFVIVGGGSAGCALANRLSADPANTVLVLEAGRNDSLWDVFVHMPAALPFPIGSRFYDWKYESEPEPYMHGRRIYHARGKVLGGSSSINGMIFQRGNPLDYERWGIEEWDFAHCLPYFKKMERCLAGADEWRGGDGPIVLERGPAEGPLFDAFFAAVQQAGYELTDDVNGYRQEGFARFDRTIRRGRRVSAARAYLHPAMGRPNLEVRCNTFVGGIVF